MSVEQQQNQKVLRKLTFIFRYNRQKNKGIFQISFHSNQLELTNLAPTNLEVVCESAY